MTASPKWFLLAATFATMGSAIVYSPSIASTDPLTPKRVSWTINDVSDDSHPDQSYCTAKNKYESGMQLIWARNQTGDTSLAIDYQKPVFDPNKMLNVVVSSGDVVRDFDVNASSTEAIVVRLKDDPLLWHALKTTKRLNAEIGGNIYDFAMPHIDQADQKLEACLAKLQSNYIADHVYQVSELQETSLNQNIENDVDENIEAETVIFNAPRTIEEKELKPLMATETQDFDAASGGQDIVLHKSDLSDIVDGQAHEPEKTLMAQLYEQEIELSNDRKSSDLTAMNTTISQPQNNDVVVASLDVAEPMQEVITFEPAPVNKPQKQTDSNRQEPPTYYKPLDDTAINEEVKRIEERERQQKTQAMSVLEKEQQKLKDENAALRIELGMVKAQKESAEEIIQKQQEARVQTKPIVASATETASRVAQSTMQHIPAMKSVDATNVQFVIAAIDPRSNVTRRMQADKYSKQQNKKTVTAQSSYQQTASEHRSVQSTPSETVMFEGEQDTRLEAKEQDIVVSAHAMDFENMNSNNILEVPLSQSQKHENMLLQKMHAKQPLSQINKPEVARIEERLPVYNATPQKTHAQIQTEPKNAPAYNGTMSARSSDEFIENILISAQIQTNDPIQMIEPAAGGRSTMYQWQSYGVYASAEQVPVSNNANFESYVSEYLERTQSRCTGDFSIVPDQSFGEGVNRVDSYEIACLSDVGNSSASILFFINQGNFTSIAHETAIDDLDAAMDLRDRILSVIRPA